MGEHALSYLVDSMPQKPSKPFVPPPRPAELQPSAEITHRIDLKREPTVAQQAQSAPATKPEHNLLDAILAAKERKASATRSIPPEPVAPKPGSFKFPKIPPQAWAAAGGLLVLGGVAWGIAHHLNRSSAPIAAVAAPTAAANPVFHAPPPPPIPSGFSARTREVAPAPPPLPVQAQDEYDRERERERDREDRERERDRDPANNDTSAQSITAPVPPPPPLAQPDAEGTSEQPPSSGPAADAPPPPPPLPE